MNGHFGKRDAEGNRSFSAGDGWGRAASVAAACAFIVFAAAFALHASVLSAQAKGAQIYTSTLSDVGAGGYDVVAFFREGKPVKGDAKFTHGWRGATWRFSSASYRNAFVADPASFAPAYGGHCSWAAAQGYKASGDPLQWRIVDGRLFLNYNAEIKARWEGNIPGFIASGDQNWTTLAEK